MASNLDDFFAKKDKSKKNRKKYSTPGDLAKELEETGKGIDRKNREKEKTSNLIASKILDQSSDDWINPEDEKEKDYSGLRIQSLTIKDKEEEIKEQKSSELNKENKKNSGKSWNMKSIEVKKINAPEPTPTPTPLSRLSRRIGPPKIFEVEEFPSLSGA